MMNVRPMLPPIGSAVFVRGGDIALVGKIGIFEGRRDAEDGKWFIQFNVAPNQEFHTKISELDFFVIGEKVVTPFYDPNDILIKR